MAMNDQGILEVRSIDFANTHTTSGIFVPQGKHVYIEMEADVFGGTAYGIRIKEAETGGILILNVRMTLLDSRLFNQGTPSAVVNTPYEMLYGSDIIKADGTNVLGLEITEDNTFYLTVNGVQYASRNIPGWQGGYLGVWTNKSDFDVVSYTLNYVDDGAAEEPVVEEPVVEEPVVEEPVVEEPVVEEPAVEEPVVEAPVVEAPKTVDAVIMIAAAAILSSGAAIISKKRK